MDVNDRAFCREQINAIRRATTALEMAVSVPNMADQLNYGAMSQVGLIEQALGLIVGRLEGAGNYNQMALNLTAPGRG